jgi:hypothetical protein
MSAGLFAKKCEPGELTKLKKITTKSVDADCNAIAMCRPDSIFVNTGSEAEKLPFVR